MVELFDLHTARGITFILSLVIMSVFVIGFMYCLVRLTIETFHSHKIKQAMQELGTMSLDEWEAKWADYIHKGYIECNDPHRQEVEENMEFFRKELAELKKEEQD